MVVAQLIECDLDPRTPGGLNAIAAAIEDIARLAQKRKPRAGRTPSKKGSSPISGVDEAGARSPLLTW
jgi:hypothetical protein